MTTLPGRSKDHFSPLDYAKMLTESLVRSKTPFTPEIVEELKKEFQATFDKIPGKVCERYIYIFDPAKQLKEQKKKQQKRKEENNRILNWGVSLIPHLTKDHTLDIQLAAYLQKEFNITDFYYAQKIAEKAIQKYKATKDKEPKFKSADTLLEEKKDISSLKSPSTTKIIVEVPKRKELALTQEENGTESARGMGISQGIDSEFSIKLNDRDQKIVIILYSNSIAVTAQKIVEKRYFISKSAFYRRLKKLEKLGIVHKLKGTSVTEFLIDPNFLESSPIFLRECQGSVPVLGSPSQTASFGESTKESGDSESDSIPIPVPFSSISKVHSEESETRPISPRKTLPNDEKKDDFSQIIVRSHNFFYKIPIQRKPAQLDKMLTKTTWLELKRMNNWHYYHGEFSKFGIEAKIQFKPNVVLVWLNEIYGIEPEDNLFFANEKILKIRAYLEDLYPGLKLAPAQFLRMIENSGVHHAWVHHTLALKAKQRNITLRGQNWEIDSSKDQPELEAIDPPNSDQHLVNEMEDFDDRAKTGVYTRHLRKRQESLLKQLPEIQTLVSSNNQVLCSIQETIDQDKSSISNELLQQLVSLNEQHNELISDVSQNIIDLNLELSQGRKSDSWSRDISKFQVTISLSKQQAALLEKIRGNPGFTRRELAEKFQFKRGYVNGTVPRLKKHHLIYEHQNKLYFKNQGE